MLNSEQNHLTTIQPDRSPGEGNHSLRNEDLSDDDDGCQIVYNHDYLESLQGLCKRRNEEATTITSSTDHEGLENKCCRSDECLQTKKGEGGGPMQLSVQEKIARTSLEKLHTLSFGANQEKCPKISFENHALHLSQEGNTLIDLISTDNSLSKNDNQEARPLSLAGKAVLGKMQSGEPEEAIHHNSGTWSAIMKEVTEFEEKHLPKRNLQTGNQLKKKLKFSIREVRPRSSSNDALVQTNHTGMNVSIAQRFDALLKSEISTSSIREHLGPEKSKEPATSYSCEVNKTQRPWHAKPIGKGKSMLPTSSRHSTSKSNSLALSYYKEGDGLDSYTYSPVKSRKTLNDQFHEALNAGSEINSLSSNNGCRGPAQDHVDLIRFRFSYRLQRVLRQEKQQRLQFMRMLHSSRVPDDTNCMDVQICERAFEAKLTVCKCAIKRLSENFLRTSLHFEVSNLITVIFSPRMNENIDIETGKTIRIHSP